MEDSTWTNITISKKRELFLEYIENERKKNNEDYEKGIINDLTYNKNYFFLQTLKKDKIKYKNFNVIIKNNLIYQIKDIKRNEEGLIYFYDGLKQTKLPNYRIKRKNSHNININKENKKPDSTFISSFGD